ncbi:hypothetical protein A6P39_002665 [Streptomyces sp. FXJ1.172]|uniref:hypothetical protein n=1 Tax=Streptomyces sp. FXJ1.172 TaxID=710705 RepID=UPI0007CF5954|nr:hypothetical protein [Streptomyces sp. FXJ1.172]WEO93061.1 hypothetical protein A6P39_002665 [Streptomyces sp. FXJ1.172]
MASGGLAPRAQGRRWYRHNPTGADTVTAATKAADAARERIAEYLLASRLEQLCAQTAVRLTLPAARRWTTARPGGDCVSTELSGIDLARQALTTAWEEARKTGGARQAKPKRRTGQVVRRRGGRGPLEFSVAIAMPTERGMAAPAAGGMAPCGPVGTRDHPRGRG